MDCCAEDGKGCPCSCLAGTVLLLVLLLSVTLSLGCGTIPLCFVELRLTRGETENIQDCSNPFVESLCSATVCFLLLHLPSWLLTFYFGVFC